MSALAPSKDISSEGHPKARPRLLQSRRAARRWRYPSVLKGLPITRPNPACPPRGAGLGEPDMTKPAFRRALRFGRFRHSPDSETRRRRRSSRRRPNSNQGTGTKPVRASMMPKCNCLAFTDGSSGSHDRFHRPAFSPSLSPVPPGDCVRRRCRVSGSLFIGLRYRRPGATRAFVHHGPRLDPSDSALACASPAARSRTLDASRDCPAIAGGPAFVVSERLTHLGFRGSHLPGPRHVLLSLELSSLTSRPPVPREPHCFRAHLPISAPRTH
jgi:hypothetical protein